METTPVTLYKKYKCSLGSSNYVMPNGKMLYFVGGTFITKQEDEIAALEHEIKQGNQYIYVDKNDSTVEYEGNDPLASIKRKAVEEYLAAQAKAMDAAANITTSDASQVKPTSTADLGGNVKLSNIKIGPSGTPTK